MTEWTEDGRPAKWTTTIETEFDANERDSWYALAEYRRALCPLCGNLRAICSDPEGITGHGFYPQRDICWATATREVATRAWRDKNEKARPDDAGFLPGDGVTVWASAADLTPEDDFLRPHSRQRPPWLVAPVEASRDVEEAEGHSEATADPEDPRQG